MSELLTLEYVARVFRVDITTVRRWIKAGSLEAVFPDDRKYGVRIKRETFDKMLTTINKENK